MCRANWSDDWKLFLFIFVRFWLKGNLRFWNIFCQKILFEILKKFSCSFLLCLVCDPSVVDLDEERVDWSDLTIRLDN